MASDMDRLFNMIKDLGDKLDENSRKFDDKFEGIGKQIAKMSVEITDWSAKSKSEMRREEIAEMRREALVLSERMQKKHPVALLLPTIVEKEEMVATEITGVVLEETH